MDALAQSNACGAFPASPAQYRLFTFFSPSRTELHQKSSRLLKSSPDSSDNSHCPSQGRRIHALTIAMASNFQIQQPYVLATLPRPLDPKLGRYVVGEVYGTSEGSKKRKRSEVAIGVDGEAVNIYDVSLDMLSLPGYMLKHPATRSRPPALLPRTPSRLSPPSPARHARRAREYPAAKMSSGTPTSRPGTPPTK